MIKKYNVSIQKTLTFSIFLSISSESHAMFTFRKFDVYYWKVAETHFPKNYFYPTCLRKAGFWHSRLDIFKTCFSALKVKVLLKKQKIMFKNLNLFSKSVEFSKQEQFTTNIT